MKQKKHFYTLLALLAAVMISFPLFLQLKPQAASAPGKTTLTKITATDYNKIKIQWKKTSGATNYIVYYRKHGTSKWTKLATTKSTSSSYTHTSSSSKPIIVGQEYDYTVKAYNSKTKKSGKYNTKGLTVKTIPQTITLNKATLTSDEKAVTISWNKAAGCNKYIVYRKTGSSDWKKIKTIKSVGTTSYTDKSPVKGTINTYTVKAYYSKTKTFGKYDTKGVSVSVPYIIDIPVKPTATPKPTPTPAPKADPEKMAQEVFRLTNIERVKHGKQPLIYNKTLQKGAMARAKEISVFFSHTRPDGQDGEITLIEAGVANCSDENIASGYSTPESVVQGWMNSPGHKVALIRSTNVYLGVGFYENPVTHRYYWVQAFTDADPDEKGTVVFNANGGTFSNGDQIYTITKPSGTRIYVKDIPVPTRKGYTFNGWISQYNERLNSCVAGKNTETFHAEWVPA